VYFTLIQFIPMADVRKNVLVNHSAERMFKLVDQIEDYPLFLPWCGGSKVITRNDDITKASIHIKYSGVNQSFTTQNTKQFPNRIDLTLIDGPFKKLEGYWIFNPIHEEACSIEFHLHYEFSNFILEKLISPIFSRIANTFVDGFVTQADKIYPHS
jgi:ribosome-associated toxin RatA of RatAB toxin-antitoxin module